MCHVARRSTRDRARRVPRPLGFRRDRGRLAVRPRRRTRRARGEARRRARGSRGRPPRRTRERHHAVWRRRSSPGASTAGASDGCASTRPRRPRPPRSLPNPRRPSPGPRQPPGPRPRLSRRRPGPGAHAAADARARACATRELTRAEVRAKEARRAEGTAARLRRRRERERSLDSFDSFDAPSLRRALLAERRAGRLRGDYTRDLPRDPRRRFWARLGVAPAFAGGRADPRVRGDLVDVPRRRRWIAFDSSPAFAFHAASVPATPRSRRRIIIWFREACAPGTAGERRSETRSPSIRRRFSTCTCASFAPTGLPSTVAAFPRVPARSDTTHACSCCFTPRCPAATRRPAIWGTRRYTKSATFSGSTTRSRGDGRPVGRRRRRRGRDLRAAARARQPRRLRGDAPRDGRRRRFRRRTRHLRRAGRAATRRLPPHHALGPRGRTS